MLIDMSEFFEKLSKYLKGEYEWEYIDDLCRTVPLDDDFIEYYARKQRLYRVLK